MATLTPENRLLLQGFEWHTQSIPPAAHETQSPSSHYARLTRLLPSLAELGVTSLWLPPGCKGDSPQGNGYDIYDLWDLGEFDRHGVRSTKWGSREELDDLLATGRECGVEMIWDAVLNHKAGADGTEERWAVEVDSEDRRFEICAPKKIEAWLRFDFRGRERDGELKYSNFRWRADHFNGVDWDQKTQKKVIHKLIDDPSTTSERFRQPKSPSLNPRKSSGSFFKSLLRGPKRPASRVEVPPPQRPGKGWAEDVDKEHGNNDYLMFSNVDYTHPEVRRDVVNWGRWMIWDVGVNGFRLDAAQHFSFSFTRDWIQDIHNTCRERQKKDVFMVGEVWTGELRRITDWLDAVHIPSGPQVYAYDSPLLYNLSRLSQDMRKGRVDLRTILRGSLVEKRPEAAVTLVTNHDTQPGQTSYTPMSSALKPLFYAFILLRQEGLPCVFWGDLFGTRGPHAQKPIRDDTVRASLLGDLMLCRRLFAYGKQTDYWKSRDGIGWTRAGTGDRPGCAVVFSVGNPKMVHSIDMAIGASGEAWVDILGNCSGEVTIDDAGNGRFSCYAFGVSIYVKKKSNETERFPVAFDVGAAG